MKKVTIMILVLALLLTLAGCGQSSGQPDPEKELAACRAVAEEFSGRDSFAIVTQYTSDSGWGEQNKGVIRFWQDGEDFLSIAPDEENSTVTARLQKNADQFYTEGSGYAFGGGVAWIRTTGGTPLTWLHDCRWENVEYRSTAYSAEGRQVTLVFSAPWSYFAGGYTAVFHFDKQGNFRKLAMEYEIEHYDGTRTRSREEVTIEDLTQEQIASAIDKEYRRAMEQVKAEAESFRKPEGSFESRDGTVTYTWDLASVPELPLPLLPVLDVTLRDLDPGQIAQALGSGGEILETGEGTYEIRQEDGIYGLTVKDHQILYSIFRSPADQGQLPTDDQMKAAQALAQEILDGLDLGAYAVTSVKGEPGEISLRAAPVFEGAPALADQPDKPLWSKESFQTPISRADLRFSPDGKLRSLHILSPVAVKEVFTYGAEPQWPLDILLDMAGEELKNYGSEAFAQGMGKADCTVTITGAEYGLARSDYQGKDGVFIYRYSLLCKGTVRFYDKITGALLEELPDQPLVTIDAGNGDIL